ncbi:hypothetical protein E6P97_03750 [Patescibacteria group bacterium]|nr:MAG: hypothetical protein E6P97_03750 [Patescibacteria group bacterium]
MSNYPAKPPIEFRYFSDPAERAMIAECGFRVAEYLHEEQIGSLVLVDQAARNIHIPVRDAWDIAYPEAAKPTVYFLNPDGFLSPDIHTDADYAQVLSKAMIQRTGMTQHDFMLSKALIPKLADDIMHGAQLVREHDTQGDRRHEIAAQLTDLAAIAIPRDGHFNGRVLVLDACRHSGGSTEGITRALKDIGIIDVRTGVVNNTRNETEDPDFVVFENDEIEDVCKPFGPQLGLGRTPDLVSESTAAGLHEYARMARTELHHMKSELAELRETFAEGVRQRQETARLPMDIRSLLGEIFGSNVVIEAVDGLLLPRPGENDSFFD